MYQKVRSRLTVLFSSVTSTLLFFMLLISFYLTYDSQLSLQLANFTRQSVSAADEISRQNVLTTDWLRNMETSGSYYLFLLDQQTPVFHNSRHPKTIQNMFEEAQHCLSVTLLQDITSDSFKKVSDEYEIYLHKDHFFPEYFVYINRLAKNNGILQVFTIQPLEYLNKSLLLMLGKYLLLFILAGSALIFFSWCFTGRLLRPLEEARLSQNAFISNASHELRTPLAVILANVSACRTASSEHQGRYFDVIERVGFHMSTLIEQLLTLSRADSHALTLNLSETDLQTLLLEVYESFYTLAAKEKHLLSIHLPEEDIPVCHCDSFRVKQILTILIQNACSYTPEGCEIQLSMKCKDHVIELSVEDNGPGVPDSEKEKIFERFFRGEAAHSEKGHHGLGLSVAKEIAAAHNGSLYIKDSVSGGAIFTLTLPQL